MTYYTNLIDEATLIDSINKDGIDNVNWTNISEYQKLTESFIEKYKYIINWYFISKNQKLTESFIEKYKDNVNWTNISRYQKLTESFIEKYNLKISENNWLYNDQDERLEIIKSSNLYVIEGDYIIAYKGIRKDRYSKYNFQYKYDIGETYECHANFNIDHENSFGLSVWTLDEAKEYCNELIIKVKIHKSNIASIVHNGHKLRCDKFTVMEDVV